MAEFVVSQTQIQCSSQAFKPAVVLERAFLSGVLGVSFQSLALNYKTAGYVGQVNSLRTKTKCAIPSEEISPKSSKKPISFRVVEATKSSEILGACSLRSHSFLNYPEGRSESARVAHRKMQTEQQFEILQRNAFGIVPGLPHFSCLVALMDATLFPTNNLKSTDLDSNFKVPQSEGIGFDFVVGTLDLNVGSKLAGEELVGLFPTGELAPSQRAYLSNVCVSHEVRRSGVARALISRSMELAVSWGVEELYVHVIAENEPAKLLYFGCGFEVEQEETAAMAKLLCRPRRLLLRQPLR